MTGVCYGRWQIFLIFYSPMQKSILIPLIAVSVLSLQACDTASSSASAAKKSQHAEAEVIPLWAGKYQGTTPCMACFSRCDECPGMSVDLLLNPDQTFVLNRISLSGHNDIETLKGQFKFKGNDTKFIELTGLNKRNLIMVDLEHQLLEIREDLTGNGFVEFEDFSLQRSS